jgi:AcrR family transcriptional regulator
MIPPATQALPRAQIEDLRRAELVAATLRVVSARGFDRATVRDIAKAADASVGSVNYYFKSKDDLLRTAIAETDRQFRVRVREAVTETQGHADKLTRVIELCFPVDEQEGPDWDVFVDFWYQASRHEAYRAIFSEAHLEWIEMLTQVLEDGVSEGTFRLTAPAHEEAIRFASMIDGLAVYTRVTDHVDAEVARGILKEHIAGLLAGTSNRARKR